MRLGIVASRFNDALASKLLERAQREAKKLGAQSSVVSVPGALEIPLALQWMAQSGHFDALVAMQFLGREGGGRTERKRSEEGEDAHVKTHRWPREGAGVLSVSLESGMRVPRMPPAYGRAASRS